MATGSHGQLAVTHPISLYDTGDAFEKIRKLETCATSNADTLKLPPWSLPLPTEVLEAGVNPVCFLVGNTLAAHG